MRSCSLAVITFRGIDWVIEKKLLGIWMSILISSRYIVSFPARLRNRKNSQFSVLGHPLGKDEKSRVFFWKGILDCIHSEQQHFVVQSFSSSKWNFYTNLLNSTYLLSFRLSLLFHLIHRHSMHTVWNSLLTTFCWLNLSVPVTLSTCVWLLSITLFLAQFPTMILINMCTLWHFIHKQHIMIPFALYSLVSIQKQMYHSLDHWHTQVWRD